MEKIEKAIQFEENFVQKTILSKIEKKKIDIESNFFVFNFLRHNSQQFSYLS